MSWLEPVDAYCERLGPGYWAEPVNALTNLAFLLAAAVMARRLEGANLPVARALCVILAAIGVGSYLFHTFAQAWAGLADVLPILGFILLYLFAACRDFLGLPPWAALLGAALFLPFAASLAPLFRMIPVLGVSAAYLPVPVLIAGFAVYLRPRAPGTARGLALGAALLLVSVLLRSLDAPLCNALPVGTHFAWHLLNALMLGWMIEVYCRHMLAPPPPRR